MDLEGKRVVVSVLFDVVRIEIHCGDDYEAQVAYDDMAGTLKAGGKIELSVNKSSVAFEHR